jgi:hypothetical protein
MKPTTAGNMTIQRLLRKLAFDMAFCAATIAIVPSLTRAQVTKAVLHVEGDIPVFAIAPDNRVAYAVRHIKRIDKTEVERDDLWVVTLGGKRDRLLDSQKIVKGSKPANCVIREIRWAPDSHHLVVGLLTAAMGEEDVDLPATARAIPLDDSHHEVPIESALATAIDAANAAWLSDGSTVVFLNGASEHASRLTSRVTGISSIRPPSGKAAAVFGDSTFEGVDWDISHNRAIAVERDLGTHADLQLEWLDLANQKKRAITSLPNFQGQLTLSPSGNRVAYFSDVETIEIRDLAAPAKAISLHVPPGYFEWAPGEQYLLLKRGGPAHSTEIFWIHIPDGGMQPILRDLVFGSFQISPDGNYLGLQNAGQTGFQLIPMPTPGS